MFVKLFKIYFIITLLIFSSLFLMSNVVLAQEGDSGDEKSREEIIADTEASNSQSADENNGSDDALVKQLNQQIAEQRKKIDELAKQIEIRKDKIKKAQRQTITLQNQVYIIDNQMAKTKLDIDAKEEEITATELEIKKVGVEIKENENTIQKEKIQLGAFIRQLDLYDQKDYLSILLSNDSFSEFFDQIKYLEGVEADLQNTLNRVQEQVEKLTAKKSELNNKRDQLSDLLNKLEQEKAILNSQKRTKQYLISETQNSERRFQKMLEELKAEKISVNNQVASLERQLREQLKKRGEGEKFNSFGDPALIWPTAHYSITTYFHDPDYPYRYLFEHSGIDIATPMGTPLRAAEAGYVARVSYGTRWYGNYIMIIHNNSLATLYAHLSSINVKTDQYVAKGEVIGHTGSTGFSTGPHLHFEVRYNGIPVNPLNYID